MSGTVPAGRLARWVVVVLVVLTIAFQAAYVFIPGGDVRRKDGYDADAHYGYLEWVRAHPDDPLGFRGAYVWIHFPTFYQLNAAAIDAACAAGVPECERRGLQAAWLFQAGVHAATLVMLLALFRRALPSAALAALGLALAATSPRVFFAPSLWNQDVYVLCAATVCMLAAVLAARRGLGAGLVAAVSVAAAVGFAFKTTIVIPLAAVAGTILLLPAACAAAGRKIGALVLVGAVVVLVNLRLFATADGRAHVGWFRTSQYLHVHRNSQDVVRAYLTVDPAPLVRPEPIYRPAGPRDLTNAHSSLTATWCYLFELNDLFQGPPRTWLNLICLWSGTPLLALALWRAATVVGKPWTRASEDVLCALVVLLSAAALLYFSLGLPYGWAAHPEYVLAAYPAAVVLALRQASALRPGLARGVFVLAAVHLAANVALLAHVAAFKIGG